MKAIVAVDKNWGIGRNNDLLFSLPLDMKFFRETTLNKVVVMGRKTLESFPNGKPLKNRLNVVLSRNLKQNDCVVLKNLEELASFVSKYPKDDVFVIGGASVYKTLLPYCSEILVTKVFADGNAEVFFENLDALDNFECVYTSEPLETNGITIQFTTYQNNSVKKL